MLWEQLYLNFFFSSHCSRIYGKIILYSSTLSKKFTRGSQYIYCRSETADRRIAGAYLRVYDHKNRNVPCVITVTFCNEWVKRFTAARRNRWNKRWRRRRRHRESEKWPLTLRRRRPRLADRHAPNRRRPIGFVGHRAHAHPPAPL